MFRASTLRLIGRVLLIAVALLTGYMLLDRWLIEVDACSPLICTEGYPCFDQGQCHHWVDPSE